MKMTWKNERTKKPNKRTIIQFQDLPFDDSMFPKEKLPKNEEISHVNGDDDTNTIKLVDSFQQEGNKLAEEGKYREALGKWESALLLMPDRAILQEQKAQILLELGETWKALKAATRATELEPSWVEAWVTLGRAQLNYGEPDSAIESLDRALAIKSISEERDGSLPLVSHVIRRYHLNLKPDSAEVRNDRQAALHHIQRRKQLQTSGLSMNQNRFAVVDKTEGA